MARQLDARVARRRAAVACRLMPARLSPAPYMPGPTPDVPWDPPTSAGRPARTELICLVMRTRGSLPAYEIVVGDERGPLAGRLLLVAPWDKVDVTFGAVVAPKE